MKSNNCGHSNKQRYILWRTNASKREVCHDATRIDYWYHTSTQLQRPTVVGCQVFWCICIVASVQMDLQRRMCRLMTICKLLLLRCGKNRGWWIVAWWCTSKWGGRQCALFAPENNFHLTSCFYFFTIGVDMKSGMNRYIWTVGAYRFKTQTQAIIFHRCLLTSKR